MNNYFVGNVVECIKTGQLITIKSISESGINIVNFEGLGVYPTYEFTEIKGVDLIEDHIFDLGFLDNNIKMGGTIWYELDLNPLIHNHKLRIYLVNGEWKLTHSAVSPPTQALKTVKYLHELQNFINQW